MNRDDLLNSICPTSMISNCRNCDECSRLLSKMLDKYDKYVIEQYKADTNLKDTIKEIHDNVAHEMYCKGIDDFAKASRDIIYNYYTEQAYIKYNDFCKIAKQLKTGIKNEN